MNRLLRTVQAGTLESTDILITLSPAEPGTGIVTEVVSATLRQYGDAIVERIKATLTEHGITDAHVHANDKGAWDYVIEARMKVAIIRATQEGV